MSSPSNADPEIVAPPENPSGAAPLAPREARGEEFRVKAREGLPPALVRELSALSPLRATWSILANVGGVALCLAAALVWRTPLVWAAAIVGIAAGQHGLAILVHQSAHYRLFESRRLNDAVGRACAVPLGVSMITYRIIHRIHHNHLYEPIDPDMALMAGYPRGRAYLLRKLGKDLSGVTSVKNYLYFFGRTPKGDGKRTSKFIDDTSPALKAAGRRDRRLVIWGQLALLALFVAAGFWREYLLLWLLPLVTVLQALLRLRAVCEHGAVEDTSTPLRAARTTLAPVWVRWALFPHSMHYHIEHHLYPSVPHYRLAACHRALAEAGALDRAEVVRTFPDTLRRIFAAPRA